MADRNPIHGEVLGDEKPWAASVLYLDLMQSNL
jgi:hypothetical protein